MIVVLPMAGRGSRFKSQNLDRPKPLIEVLGRPMFLEALKSLGDLDYSKLVIVALEEHEEAFGISNIIAKELNPSKTELVLIPDVTDGQLCTVLAAKKYITADPLLIITSDTYIKSQLSQGLAANPKAEGLIQVKSLPGDSWSFARMNEKGDVVEVSEKVRISEWASTGIYYFQNGERFVTYAEEMIENEERTRGEFYVMPLYSKYLKNNFVIRTFEADEMWDMGTPEGLATYLKKLKKTKNLL